MTDQNVSASLNTPLNITLGASDADNDSLYHSIISQPKKGTLSKIDQNTSTLVYTPNPGFTGMIALIIRQTTVNKIVTVAR